MANRAIDEKEILRIIKVDDLAKEARGWEVELLM